MRQQTTKELFKNDLRTLREIASKEALRLLFIEQNRETFHITDGRKMRSKKYLSTRKFYPAIKNFNNFHAALNVYKAWKYLGVNAVKAGKIYSQLVESKLKYYRSKNLNLELTGAEIEWELIAIHTDSSRYKDQYTKNKSGRYGYPAAVQFRAA